MAGISVILRQLRTLMATQRANGQTDAYLLEQFVSQRDEVAFAALLERHGPMVLGVCRRILHDEHLAEDAFQATFLVLVRKASSIRKQQSVASWLHGVALRLAHRAKAEATQANKHDARNHSQSVVDVQTEASWNESQEILDDELQRLPENYRLPLVHCYLEGLTRDEAAARLGWTANKLRGHLERGRDLLRWRLVRRGVTLATAASATLLADMVLAATVPPLLTVATIHAATTFAGGTTLTPCGISASVGALTEGALKMMAAKKTSAVLALVLLAAIIGSGVGIFAQRSEPVEAPQPPALLLAQEVVKNDEPKKEPVDRFGDPLPEGAAARLGSLRFRHHGEARALAFTADSKTLVAYTASGFVIWDATTGKERLRLPLSLPNFASGIDISPDGTTLAVSEAAEKSDETQVGLWNLQSGKKTRTLSLPKAESQGAQFDHLCFARDGKSLALSYTNSGKAVVFDLASGKVRASFGGRDSQAFYNIAVSPDSRTLAASANPQPNSDGFKHSIQLLDIATGRLIRSIHELAPMSGETFVRSIAFSTDGKMLAIGIMDTILLFDPSTGKKVSQLEAEKMGQVTGMGFTPDGAKLVSGSESDGKVRIWDVVTRKALHTLDGRMFLGRTMALSPDGKTVALGTVGHTVRLWDVATGKELFTEHLGHDSQINSLAFSPDGKILVSAGDFRQTFLWDTTSWKRRGLLAGSAIKLSFSPNGKQLATVARNSFDRSNNVRIWDVAAAKVELTITVPGAWDVSEAIISPDGRKVFTLNHTLDTSGYGKAQVHQWDVLTGKQDHAWPVPQEVSWRASLTPDGKTLVAALQTGGISIYNAELRRKRHIHSAPMEWHSTLSPDGKVLASGMSGPDCAVRLWEIITGKEIALLKGHRGTVAVTAWSPDSRLLASGDRSEDRVDAQTVRLWDAASGKALACFGGFKTDVTALTFSPDGMSLVAGMRDSSIVVWKVDQFHRKLKVVPKLTSDELESCWTDLIGDNASRAHRAIGVLVVVPRQAVLFLQSKLMPTPVADHGKIQQWIADLNSSSFAVRQSATKQLLKLDAQAQAPLQTALKGTLSLETRRRLEQILDWISDIPPDPSAIRMMRAVMILERIGSPEAQAILQVLGRGAPGARTTEAAEASLTRLAARGSVRSRPKSD